MRVERFLLKLSGGVGTIKIRSHFVLGKAVLVSIIFEQIILPLADERIRISQKKITSKDELLCYTFF